MWGREPAATSFSPSLCPQWGPVQMGAQLLCLRHKGSSLVSTCLCAQVCICVEGERRGFGVCLFTGETIRHLPTCSRSHREQDALTLIYTYGSWKPQPRQQRVHRSWVGGGATEAGCAGVHQQAREGQCGGVVSSPVTPRPGRRADGIERSWTSPRAVGHSVQPLWPQVQRSHNCPPLASRRSSHFSHRFSLLSAAAPTDNQNKCLQGI